MAKENVIWEDSRTIPAYAAMASFIVLLLHAIWTLSQGRKLAGETSAVVTVSGSRHILTYKVSRVLACLILFGLSVATLLQKRAVSTTAVPQICVSAVFAYASLLSLFTLSKSFKRIQMATGHLVFVLLVTWAVYVYRDIWPLATFNLKPKDAGEGQIIWAKLGVLSFAAVIVPIFIPKPYIPIDPENSSTEPNPEETSSWFSFVYYTYIDRVVLAGFRKRHIGYDELPSLSDQDAMKILAEKNYRHLDPLIDNGSPKPHIFWGLLRVFWVEHLVMALVIICRALASFIAPSSLNEILEYFEHSGKDTVVRPWVWVLGLFFGSFITSLFTQQYNYFATRTLVRFQAIVTQLVFDHALRIRLKSEASRPQSSQERSTSTASASAKKDQVNATPESPKKSNMIGKINNLVTDDLASLQGGQSFMSLVFLTPSQILITTIFLYKLLGWSAFLGMGTMLALLFIPGHLNASLRAIQAEKMKKSDARVQAVTESMGGVIRMIKLFGWERKMGQQIDEKRQAELKQIQKVKLITLITSQFGVIIPILTMIVTYTSYTVVMKGQLSASRVFASMAVFQLLQAHLRDCFSYVSQVVRAKVSLDRIDGFLKNTELLDAFQVKSTPVREENIPIRATEADFIGIRESSFTWDDDSNNTVTPRDHRRFKLTINDTVTFKRGCINLIIGKTGAGKTSMLMALLGEMHYKPLSSRSVVSLPRENGIAYHAQESWVLNDTIRSNILFGSPYDEERYDKVLDQCALKPDIALFDAGDQTEVGEKGVTLSGGQKARITLARAVYSSAEILLLDDVLAALDVHTSRWIVERCLQGELVQGRTVILVTHNVALATPVADFVVSLSPNGHVLSQGSLSSALEKDRKLALEVQQEYSQIEKVEEKFDEVKPDEAKPRKSSGKLVIAEEVSMGRIGLRALKLFFGNMGQGKLLFVIWISYLGGICLSKLSSILATWVLGLWAEQYGLHSGHPEEVSVAYHLALYISASLGTVVLAFVGYIAYVVGTIRASRVIHQRLVDTILGTTLRWLDKTPSARIIARCTQDIASVDGAIPSFLSPLLDYSFELLLKFGVILVMSPLTILPMIGFFVAESILGQAYMKVQLPLKREMSNAKSPVLAHFSSAMAGLVSIRAYGAQNAFRQESFARIDRFSRAARTYWNLNRWFNVRGDTLGGIFASSVAVYLVYGSSQVNASGIGFSLTMTLGVSVSLMWWIRHLNEFEVSGNSLERIQQYLEIEQEPRPTTGGVPPAYWPASGDLRVEKLCARYSSDGPDVLHEVSFHVKSGERVGIVGRTGSGKSSLTLSLLRGILTQGKVYYDGLATDTINLDALRSHITIIPQVPELLTGTLRENLDPFSQHEDAILNDALHTSGLYSLQSEGDGGRLTLDSAISGGGSNLSVGQRQIIALARALVRQSKLLILDEATSAIDYKTDTIIQSSLRKVVQKDVTLLTVAHRLQTIMDADKILVLDTGRVVEYDTPAELLKNDGGYLRSLVDASGDREHLYAIASHTDHSLPVA